MCDEKEIILADCMDCSWYTEISPDHVGQAISELAEVINRLDNCGYSDPHISEGGHTISLRKMNWDEYRAIVDNRMKDTRK